MIEVNEHVDDCVLALMVMEDYNGWEDAAAVWKDLQLDADYIGYFDQITVAGDKKWQEWDTKLIDPIRMKN